MSVEIRSEHDCAWRAAAEEARDDLYHMKTLNESLAADLAEARQERDAAYNEGWKAGYATGEIDAGARIGDLEAALREGTNALASHSESLSAIIDHMVEHECYCPDLDGLYRADAASADAIRAWVVKVAALQPTTDHEVALD